MISGAPLLDVHPRSFLYFFPFPESSLESLESESLECESLEPESLECESLEPESLEFESLEPESLEFESLEPECESESLELLQLDEGCMVWRIFGC